MKALLFILVGFLGAAIASGSAADEAAAVAACLKHESVGFHGGRPANVQRFDGKFEALCRPLVDKHEKKAKDSADAAKAARDDADVDAINKALAAPSGSN